MSKKSIVSGVLFSILMTSFIFLVGFTNDKKLSIPNELYQVYVDGKLIGVIENENELYKMIDNEQEELKEEYNVNKIYPPNTLETNKVITYDADINTVKEVYDVIKETEPFTVSGYQVTINYNEEGKEPIVFNILKQEDFEEAVMNTAKAFIDEEVLDAYLNDSQSEIDGEGSFINNIKIKEDVAIKKTYLPTNSKIYTNVDDINRFLLFGNNTESRKYTVQMGDTIRSVANQTSLNVSEFLIVNPDIISENALLFPGQEVNIELINPIITIALEKTVVENKTIAHETIVEYDNSISYGITNIKQAGSDGVAKAEYLYKEENGEIKQVENISTETIVEAVDEIIVKGGNKVIYVGDSSYWAWPTLQPYVITSLREWRWGRWHAGLDIAGLPTGSPIFAIQSGTVVTSVVNFGTTGYGNYVVIDHHNGYYSLYAHMFAAPYVQVGDNVNKGDIIGGMGTTGNSTGTHLHFEVHTSWPLRVGTTDIDPRDIYQ